MIQQFEKRTELSLLPLWGPERQKALAKKIPSGVGIKSQKNFMEHMRLKGP
jgi:hypothetical protein